MTSIKKKTKVYNGWELRFFDKAYIFRNYQFSFLKNDIIGDVCEVGPGHGVICDKYKYTSKNISLFEQSKKISQILKKKYKKDKKIKVFNKYFNVTGKKYDTILYLDVLEHIKYPKKELRKIIMSLKKGGKLILTVPAYQHLYSQFDVDVGHYKRYTKKTFLNEIEGLKFSNFKFYYIDSIGYFLSLASKLLIKKNYKLNFDKKIKIWNFLIYFSKIVDFLTMYSFGKSLIVIVQK